MKTLDQIYSDGKQYRVIALEYGREFSLALAYAKDMIYSDGMLIVITPIRYLPQVLAAKERLSDLALSDLFKEGDLCALFFSNLKINLPKELGLPLDKFISTFSELNLFVRSFNVSNNIFQIKSEEPNETY